MVWEDKENARRSPSTGEAKAAFSTQSHAQFMFEIACSNGETHLFSYVDLRRVTLHADRTTLTLFFRDETQVELKGICLYDMLPRLQMHHLTQITEQHCSHFEVKDGMCFVEKIMVKQTSL